MKDVYKNFNEAGEALVQRLRTFRDPGAHVLAVDASDRQAMPPSVVRPRRHRQHASQPA